MMMLSTLDAKRMEAAETLLRMVDQETHYVASDYVNNEYYDQRDHTRRSSVTKSPVSVSELDRSTTYVSTSTYTMTTEGAPFIECWRGKICKWMCKVVDSYSLDREIMTIAMMYFDRFMSTRKCTSSKDNARFQLVALSSLYLAIKLNEQRNMSIEHVLKLSNGRFCENDLVSMEMELISTLNWHLHPPTPQSFVHYLVLLIPNFKCSPTLTSCNDVKNMIFNVCNYIVELTAFESRMITEKPSTVATASILLATMGLRHDIISEDDKEHLAHFFGQFIDVQTVYPVSNILESMICDFNLTVDAIQKLFDPEGTIYYSNETL